MRGLWYGALLAGALGASACVAGARLGAVTADDPITVSGDSNVCVAVHVDQRIWPRALDADTSRNLSGILTADLRRLYMAQGGTYAVPNSQPAERFVTNEDGDTPSCHDREADVMIELRYRARSDGMPFVLDYTVSRGAARRQGSINIHVAEEIRAGRIQGHTQRRTDASIIEEDLGRRAPMIFSLLSLEI